MLSCCTLVWNQYGTAITTRLNPHFIHSHNDTHCCLWQKQKGKQREWKREFRMSLSSINIIHSTRIMAEDPPATSSQMMAASNIDDTTTIITLCMCTVLLLLCLMVSSTQTDEIANRWGRYRVPRNLPSNCSTKSNGSSTINHPIPFQTSRHDSSPQ